MLPHFLGIGAQRCGTTWLHGVLDSHPDVFMAKPKELHYFNRHILTKPLAWYEAKFEPPAGEAPKRLRGEITPGYSTLKPPTVRTIHELMPRAKLFFILRDPIGRAYSQALLELGKRKDREFEKVPIGKFMRHFVRARTTRRTDYARTIDIWSRAFGREALLVLLYDELATDGPGYLRRILTHIGADPTWTPPEGTFSKRVYANQKIDMPDIIRWYLAKQWLDPLRRLNDMLGGQVSHWVADAEAAAREARPGWALQRDLNRLVLAMPEKIAYGAYDAMRDVKLKRRCAAILAEHRAGGSRGA